VLVKSYSTTSPRRRPTLRRTLDPRPHKATSSAIDVVRDLGSTTWRPSKSGDRRSVGSQQRVASHAGGDGSLGLAGSQYVRIMLYILRKFLRMLRQRRAMKRR
jgi:hypothetical protein